eukprot:CAMPEP_0174762206 /NCGR_PEP_ID=MMETSP1094-20130205/109663_1 /TAXON_ID=156173 /ORGANISM="Chrysochromulina brevifilum, Strain UTEX LB 985" /LENGTH=93 /DNA_ID=CAMNT_0015968159 /DNA_START=509 /DNA_END=790 /DNA_ORIENTATION=+
MGKVRTDLGMGTSPVQVSPPPPTAGALRRVGRRLPHVGDLCTLKLTRLVGPDLHAALMRMNRGDDACRGSFRFSNTGSTPITTSDLFCSMSHL